MPNPTSKLNLVINGATTQLDIHDANAVDLTSNQTVAGDKEFIGTTTAHDLVPSATDTYNFGSPSVQWNNAYIKSLTINGVACGDILTHNANEFVDLSSNQTVGGVKTFTSNMIIQGGKKVVCNLDNSFIELDGGTTWGKGGSIVLSGQDRSSYTNSVLIVSKSDTNTDILQYQNGELKPHQNNTNNPSLGTPTSKWKSFNGINPGALSLPNLGWIALDTTSFDITATTIGTFTPTVDGWAILSIQQKNKHFGIWILCGGYRVTFHSVSHEGNYMIFALIPVKANVSMNIYCTANDIDSTRKIDWLRLFPCQGNV